MDQETVRTICYLARLEIDADKAQKIESDLETIIEMIGGLQEFNTDNIQPLYSPLEKTAFMHDDIEKSDNQKVKFLKNAPAANEDYFLVPRVIE